MAGAGKAGAAAIPTVPEAVLAMPAAAADDEGCGDLGVGEATGGGEAGDGDHDTAGPAITGNAAPATGFAAHAERRPAARERSPADDAEPRGIAICAPLVGMQATALGLIYVAVASGSDESALGLEDLDFLTALAGVVAVALENLQLMERARADAVASAGYRRHFAPFVAEQIASQEDRASLAGVRRRVATLACEIQGLAAIAEELHPEEIASLLSELFGEMEEVVFEHGGTLDKVTGTGLAALWGAPLSRQDDADQAVQAAIAMQRGLERLNGEWARQGRLQAPITIAVGMDLGQVFAGIVGNDRRLDYLVLGAPVRSATRLCAAAGPGEILATESLLEALSSPPPVEPLAADTARPEAAPAAREERRVDGPAYRVDWRTPPTLRQSGELHL
jgi:adenylate cyclase